jgi:low affinity Fe/Cu permease
MEIYRTVANKFSTAFSSFWMAIAIVSLTLGTGWYFEFSTRWQSAASLAASVSALLALVFLQRSQSHSDRASHVKMDEMIRALSDARDEVAAVEDESAERIEHLAEQANKK